MPENQTRENQWLAAACHASAWVFFAGLFVPLITLVNEKGRSSRLRAQALQALVYQGIAVVIYLLITAVSMLGYFGMLIMLFALSNVPNPESEAMLTVFLVLMIILLVIPALLMMVLYPAYLGVSLYAAWRTLQGHEFRYPLLGSLLAQKSAA